MGSGKLLLLYFLWVRDPWDELHISCLKVFIGLQFIIEKESESHIAFL